MPTIKKTTTSIKAKNIERGWHLYDAKHQVLGRFITDVATKLTGKHKTQYTPQLDTGDNVVVINAQETRVTGRKAQQKIYTRYSGYPGGLKEVSYERLKQKDSRKIIENAVSGMLPKNKLRKQRMRRLHIYSNDQHPFGGKFTK